ncbi:MAG: M48 family metalloprotease [Pirellulales bacterium]|nr:M48 family metalloprotease [Pirellulales bacterium]
MRPPISPLLLPRVSSMQLVLILAVLAAMAVSESVPHQPVAGATGRVALAGAAMGSVVLFALVASRLFVRRLRANLARHRLIRRQFRFVRRVHAALWLTVVGGILCGLDWCQLVRFNWHLDRTLLLDELLILAPVVMPLVLSWAAFYEFDRVVWAGVAEQPPDGSAFSTRHAYVAFHVRHYLGVLLLPLLGLLAVQDLTELWAPEFVRSGYGPLVFIPLLAGMFLLFPVLLRHVWQTRPLSPGPLRNRLEEAARRSGLRVRDILVWRTDGMVVNAAVAGFVWPWRYVFLTDALLAQMDDGEVEAIFGHEAGHIKHHHLLWRVLLMIAPLSLWLLFGQTMPETSGRLQQWLAVESAGAGHFGLRVAVAVALPAAMALYMFLVFGCFSRLLEHQADLFGCRSVSDDPQRSAVDIFTSALEKLAASGGTGRNTRTWQHASIARRIDFLHGLRLDKNRELHFHRRVSLLGGMAVGIVASPLLHLLLAG